MKISREQYLLIGIIFLYILVQTIILWNVKQIPGPLFGGDYYYNYGIIQHIISGGSAFVSSATLGGVPHYIPLYSEILGKVAILGNLTALNIMKLSSIFFMIFSLLIIYYLAYKIFKNELIALLSMLLYLPMSSFPVWKYTYWSQTFMFPLFALSLYLFFEKRSWLRIIFCGLTLGLLGLSQMVGFVIALIMFGVVTLYLLYEDFRRFWYIGLTFIIGFIISLGYWFKPLFIYHGQALTPLLSFDFEKMTTLGQIIRFSFNIIKGLFFNYNSIYTTIVSTIFLLSIFFFFFVKEYTREIKFLILMFISLVVGLWHFVVTEPLIHITVPPINIYEFIVPLVIALCIPFAIYTLLKDHKYYQYVIFTLICTLLIFGALNFSTAQNDRWAQVGRVEIDDIYKDLQTWVLANTNVNDVFVTNLELGFGVNSLTGRKTVGYRLSHTGMFVNSSENQMDNALILYSNNSDTIKGLLENRNVKYLYWNAQWISLEFTFNEQGQITSTFDPILIMDTPENRQLLQSNGVNFYPDFTFLDPGSREERFQKFNVLTVFPSRPSYEKPWSPILDQYLTEIYNYNNVSKIYKVNI